MKPIFKAPPHIPFLLVALISFPLHVLPQTTTHSTPQVLSSPKKRVIFESTPFSVGTVVPYWDKGYLISITPETTSAGNSNVRLYDATGNKVRQSPVWFPEAQTVFIINAAVTQQGNILASGTAVKVDGTRAYFIATTDSLGKVTEVIQTNPFFPANVCSGSDGTVWSFGDLGSNSDGTPLDGDILRQFDFRKGLINSYLPRSTFGKNLPPPAQRGNEGQEVYFRCLSRSVVIYTGTANQYIEFDTVTRSMNRFNLDRSVNNLPVRGFAATDHGDVFGFLRDYKSAKIQGLFHLEVDSVVGRARWIPVIGASGAKGEPGVVSGLWGADGEQLVLGYSDDPSGRWGVSWSVPTMDVRSQ